MLKQSCHIIMGEYFLRWSPSVSFVTERNQQNSFHARNFISYGLNAAFGLSQPIKELYVSVHLPSGSASNISFTDLSGNRWLYSVTGCLHTLIISVSSWPLWETFRWMQNKKHWIRCLKLCISTHIWKYTNFIKVYALLNFETIAWPPLREDPMTYVMYCDMLQRYASNLFASET